MATTPTSRCRLTDYGYTVEDGIEAFTFRYGRPITALPGMCDGVADGWHCYHTAHGRDPESGRYRDFAVTFTHVNEARLVEAQRPGGKVWEQLPASDA